MPFPQSIAMSNDRSHESLTTGKVEEAKHVQEKKQIDKIMHGVIRERLFGNFVSEDTRLSAEQHQTIDLIYKNSLNSHPTRTRRDRHRFRHRHLPEQQALAEGHSVGLTKEPSIRLAEGHSIRLTSTAHQTLTHPFFHSQRTSPRQATPTHTRTHATIDPNHKLPSHPHPHTATHTKRTISQRLPKLK